jgi:hypothetical protein
MTFKTYAGRPPWQIGDGRGVLTVFDGQNSQPLPLRLDLFNHSPTAFAWGYVGSGSGAAGPCPPCRCAGRR